MEASDHVSWLKSACDQAQFPFRGEHKKVGWELSLDHIAGFINQIVDVDESDGR